MTNYNATHFATASASVAVVVICCAHNNITYIADGGSLFSITLGGVITNLGATPDTPIGLWVSGSSIYMATVDIAQTNLNLYHVTLGPTTFTLVTSQAVTFGADLAFFAGFLTFVAGSFNSSAWGLVLRNGDVWAGGIGGTLSLLTSAASYPTATFSSVNRALAITDDGSIWVSGPNTVDGTSADFTWRFTSGSLPSPAETFVTHEPSPWLMQGLTPASETIISAPSPNVPSISPGDFAQLEEGGVIVADHVLTFPPHGIGDMFIYCDAQGHLFAQQPTFGAGSAFFYSLTTPSTEPLWWVNTTKLPSSSPPLWGVGHRSG